MINAETKLANYVIIVISANYKKNHLLHMILYFYGKYLTPHPKYPPSHCIIHFLTQRKSLVVSLLVDAGPTPP